MYYFKIAFKMSLACFRICCISSSFLSCFRYHSNFLGYLVWLGFLSKLKMQNSGLCKAFVEDQMIAVQRLFPTFSFMVVVVGCFGLTLYFLIQFCCCSSALLSYTFNFPLLLLFLYFLV